METDYSGLVFSHFKKEIFKTIQKRRSEGIIIPDEIKICADYNKNEFESNAPNKLNEDFEEVKNRLGQVFNNIHSYYFYVSEKNNIVEFGINYGDNINQTFSL